MMKVWSKKSKGSSYSRDWKKEYNKKHVWISEKRRLLLSQKDPLLWQAMIPENEKHRINKWRRKILLLKYRFCLINIWTRLKNTRKYFDKRNEKNLLHHPIVSNRSRILVFKHKIFSVISSAYYWKWESLPKRSFLSLLTKVVLAGPY